MDGIVGGHARIVPSAIRPDGTALAGRRVAVDDFGQTINVGELTSDGTITLARAVAGAIRGLNWATGHETGLDQTSIAPTASGPVLPASGPRRVASNPKQPSAPPTSSSPPTQQHGGRTRPTATVTGIADES